MIERHFCSHEVYVKMTNGSETVVALASTLHGASEALNIWAANFGNGRFMPDECGLPQHKIVIIRSVNVTGAN